MCPEPNAPVFNKFYSLTKWLLDRLERYPRSSRIILADRIGALCIDTLEGIVKALYTRQKVDILRQINLNLEVLRILMRLSKDRKHISIRQYQYATKGINEVGAMVGGWLKSQEGKGK